jgi:hypothetical protein
VHRKLFALVARDPGPSWSSGKFLIYRSTCKVGWGMRDAVCGVGAEKSTSRRINLAVLVGVGTTANETYDYDFLAPLQHPP